MRVKLSRFMTKGAPILLPTSATGSSTSGTAASLHKAKAKDQRQRLCRGRPHMQPLRPATAKRKTSVSSESAASGSKAGSHAKKIIFSQLIQIGLMEQPLDIIPRFVDRTIFPQNKADPSCFRFLFHGPSFAPVQS